MQLRAWAMEAAKSGDGRRAHPPGTQIEPTWSFGSSSGGIAITPVASSRSPPWPYG